VPECDAVLTDRVEDTVDYSEVCDIVALAATEKSYRTLERLCQVVAGRLMERFDCESVRVRAAKPEPPMPYQVQEAGVEVTLERSLDRESDDEEGV
jgi:dihydroneopterin aldolase